MISFKKNGFTFIEVLIAMGLLAIVFSGLLRFQLTSIRQNRDALSSVVAMERLQSLVVIMTLHVANFSDCYQKWNEENKRLLPDGQGEIERKGNYAVVRLYFRSHLSNRWYCQSHPRKQYTCFEWKVLV